MHAYQARLSSETVSFVSIISIDNTVLYPSAILPFLQKFMLIQWIEDPPAWDVLPVSKIVNGLCEVGYICDVEYGEETSPAKILQKGL